MRGRAYDQRRKKCPSALEPLCSSFALRCNEATLLTRPRYSEAVMKGKLTGGFRLFEGRFRSSAAESRGNYFAFPVDETKLAPFRLSLGPFFPPQGAFCFAFRPYGEIRTQNHVV